MEWRLLEYAKDAEDTAAGLHIFLSEIPEYSRDITGDIAELFAISNALRTLHDGLLPSSRYSRYSTRILRDLDIAIPSLGYTLDDVKDMFSKKKKKSKQLPGAFPGTPQYNLIWEDACDSFKAEGVALPVRLELYRSYLQFIFDYLKGDPVEDEMAPIRARLSKLLKKQEPVPHEPIDSYFSRLHMNDPRDPRSYGQRTPKPPPPVNARPEAHRFGTFPNYGPPIPPPPPSHSPIGAVYGEIPFIPPPVPEIPHSPTYSTASSQTFSTHSNDSNSGAHWATKIFDGRHSSTPLAIFGQSTKCLGRDEPQAIELLDGDGFEKVLEMPFEATNVWVRLYWRSDDHRARILFLTLDPSGRRMRYCFPLTGLRILRTESCLQLCRVNRINGKLDLWANLRFTLYERMVLFYCTLVALKRQDQVQTPQDLTEDFFQPGEKEEYGGEIQDNGSLHAFRIFKDKDSGGVRFEGTARRGPLKTVPIWTAFVTQYIGQRGWMKRVGHTTIQFKELHPYVFHQGYTLPRGPSGRYQLTFTTPEDAREFMDVFHFIKT